MMEADDAALLAAVGNGSEGAFNILIDRHQQTVRAFLRRLVADPTDADDIAQETFLAAWTRARTFRGRSSVRTWLCAIAWRKAKSSQRSAFRRRAREAAYHEQAGLAQPTKPQGEDRAAVRQALQTLPIEQRAAVVLCLAGGVSHGDAAEILGLPLGTVKSHVARGRARLLKVLEGGS